MTQDEIVEDAKVLDVSALIENFSLIVGTYCNYNGRDIIEYFRKIDEPDDLTFLEKARLRARFNSQRNYKYFYFKGNYELLHRKLVSNEAVMTIIKTHNAVTIKDLQEDNMSEINRTLLTKDGRKIGNAIIIEEKVVSRSSHSFLPQTEYMCLTDYGNIIKCYTIAELQELFYFGQMATSDHLHYVDPEDEDNETEYMIPPTEFIAKLAKDYVELRSDVSDICTDYLEGLDVSSYRPEHRHVECKVNGTLVMYDTLRTIIEYQDPETGEWEDAEDHNYC